MRRPTPRFLLLWLLTSVLPLVSACHSEPESPEAQIRALIAKAEKAAEEKDIGTLKALISDSYAAREPRDKRELVALIGFFFLHNQSIHLLTQVSEIAFPEPKHADCVVFVGMAARAIQGVGDLSSLHADILRVEFSAVDEGSADWKVTRAVWRPAGVEDLEPDSK
jgi:hypothetical protein